MEEVERSSEGTLSVEVRSSEGAVRQGSSDLPHEWQHKKKEKGTAALRKETLQLKGFKKASKDKDALKRPAGRAYGQLLAEKREIKKCLPADHKITNVIKKAGGRWKYLLADERQKMDATGISRTGSSTVNTTMKRSRLNDARPTTG